MAEPTITFLYNHGSTDSPYLGAGSPLGDWKVIDTVAPDLVVFTGGGILGTLPTPTVASGTRDATIKPTVASYVIPQTYVESGSLMYNVPLVGYTANRYCMGVYVSGSTSSDLYLESWDDNSFSTTSSEVLVGSANSSNNSYINAIRTTNSSPPWSPGWSGSDSEASYLRGTDDRIGLKNSSSISNECLYYNIYIKLEVDSVTFHNTPVLGFRYLYT
jgi:hypothetical protein